MEEEKDKTIDQPEEDNEKIKAVREEYEKKFVDLKSSHDAEIEKLKKDHIEEIRSLIAGSHVEIPNQTEDKEEKSAYDEALEELRIKFKIK